jgi:hypothetical protein
VAKSFFSCTEFFSLHNSHAMYVFFQFLFLK